MKEKCVVHIACNLTCTHPSLPLSPFPALTQPSDLHNISVIQNSFLQQDIAQIVFTERHNTQNHIAGTTHKTIPLAVPHGAVIHVYETPESFPESSYSFLPSW